MGYLGVVGECSTEKIIEKSRFLTYCARTEGEDAAKAFLADIRAKHPLATHVCYGYIADRLGNLQRFSDDGEPQGTAGMPILGVLKAQNLKETTVAVVRYFGGIKLGAGGLTRAYSSAAAECIAAAEKRNFETCVELTLAVGYSEVGTLTRVLEERGAEVLRREFGEGAAFVVAVKEREEEGFTASLTDALCGRIAVSSGERYFHPFPIE